MTLVLAQQSLLAARQAWVVVLGLVVRDVPQREQAEALEVERAMRRGQAMRAKRLSLARVAQVVRRLPLG